MKEQHSVEQATAAERPAVSRRALTAGAIWSLPVIATIGAAPAMAASSFGPLYAGSVVSAPSPWTGSANAVGSTQGTVAVWSGNQNAVHNALVLGSFGSGTKSPVESLTVNIRMRSSDTAKMPSATVTISFGGSPANVTQTITLSQTLATHNFSITYGSPPSVNLALIQVSIAGVRASNGDVSLEVDTVSVQHTH